MACEGINMTVKMSPPFEGEKLILVSWGALEAQEGSWVSHRDLIQAPGLLTVTQGSFLPLHMHAGFSVLTLQTWELSQPQAPEAATRTPVSRDRP